MSPRNRIRVAASMLFGVVVGVLALLGSPALGPVAIFGGIALGLLYALMGGVAEPGRARRRVRRQV